MSDKLKKLTGKNPKDFEPIAFSLVNDTDEELFKELVEKDNFLFDFVKQNVAKRIAHVCNESNYKNLLSFLKYYSPYYEDTIIKTLVKFADENLTDYMLERFENGTIQEKTYCAKFFEYVQDPLALDSLKKYSYNENSFLSTNCASTLFAMGEKSSYDEAIVKLKSNDEFEKFLAVKFLCAYGDKSAILPIISALKTSSMQENIAGELLYLDNIFSIIENAGITDGLYVLNCVINGLGEILSLSQIYDFQIYEILESLINSKQNPEIAVILLDAKEKFETLTENDEYLFDESKEIKNEIFEIKKLLSNIDIKNLKSLAIQELNQNSLFVYCALNLVYSENKIRELLTSTSPSLVLKALEVLKEHSTLADSDKNIALGTISDDNLKAIIEAL